MTRSRLLLVIARYFEFGGLQRDFLRIAQRCTGRGHDVHVLTGGWDGPRPDQITVHVVNTRAVSNHRSNDKLAAHLRRASAADRFDCVVGFNKIPGLDAYYAGDPCLAAKLAATRPAAVRLLPRYRAMLRQEAAVFGPDADTQILLIAHQEREKFIRHYGTPAERFSLLPPGIDRDRLVWCVPSEADRLKLRCELGIAADDVMILHVGSGFRTKGVDRAITALGSLPEPLRSRSRLVVVGKGKPKPFMKIAKSSGVQSRVIFTGARRDVAAFYYTADLLIHPAYSENTGTTLIEAMVCGMPVLVTSNCGFAFHVERAGAGIVLPEPFDQSALNAALAEMIGSERRQQWRDNGRKYCARTDLYGLIEQAVDLILARAQQNR